MGRKLFLSSVAVFVLFSVSCVVLVEAGSSIGLSRTYGRITASVISYGFTDPPFSVVEAHDGGYALVSSTDSDFWLTKTDEYIVVSELNPPIIFMDMSQNATYATSNVTVTFTVDKETSWMGYSLDGQDNVTLTADSIQLTGLSDGSHSITVYATDLSGNTGASEVFVFTVAKEPEPPPTTLPPIEVVMIIVAEVIVGAAVLGYITKTQKIKKPPTKLTPLF